MIKGIVASIAVGLAIMSIIFGIVIVDEKFKEMDNQLKMLYSNVEFNYQAFKTSRNDVRLVSKSLQKTDEELTELQKDFNWQIKKTVQSLDEMGTTIKINSGQDMVVRTMLSRAVYEVGKQLDFLTSEVNLNKKSMSKQLSNDIPKQVAKHVVAFRVNASRGRIYGTGFHIKHKNKTFIITNRHVCLAGIEINNNKKTIQVNNRIVKILKMTYKHDICALESWTNDGLELASKEAKPLDKIILVGHPRGLRTVIRRGRVIGTSTECISYPDSMICKPTTMISALAYGGNSGSPVTNERGKVVGILYAGSDSYPHEPFTVPHRFLKQFLNELVK